MAYPKFSRHKFAEGGHTVVMEYGVPKYIKVGRENVEIMKVDSKTWKKGDTVGFIIPTYQPISHPH